MKELLQKLDIVKIEKPKVLAVCRYHRHKEANHMVIKRDLFDGEEPSFYACDECVAKLVALRLGAERVA